MLLRTAAELREIVSVPGTWDGWAAGYIRKGRNNRIIAAESLTCTVITNNEARNARSKYSSLH